MDCAQAPYEIAAIDPHDFMFGYNVRQDVKRHAIIGIIECRHQHQIVGDIKIGVAGRQALLLENHGSRKRQFHDFQFRPFKSVAACNRFRFSCNGS